MVTTVAVMSISWPSRKATTEGPSTSGRKTRPTSVAASASSGSAKVAAVSSDMGNLQNVQR
jgi:hypothetical protein